MKKILQLSLILFCICSVAFSANQYSVTWRGYSINMGPAVFTKVPGGIYFTTYDGVNNQLPNVQNNAPLVSLESKPLNNGSNLYYSDFINGNPVADELYTYGWLKMTLPDDDVDGNGFPDILQNENSGNCAFNTYLKIEYDDTGDGLAGHTTNIDTTMTRNANSSSGTIKMVEPDFGTSTFDFQIIHGKNTEEYEPADGEFSYMLSYQMPNSQGNLVTYSGEVESYIENGVLKSRVFQVANGGNVVNFEATTYMRVGNTYYGDLHAVDGYPLTGWSDYCNILVEIVDDNDTDNDGEPDLTDPVLSYDLLVNNGTGSGNYNTDSVIDIEANAIAGKIFSHWDGDTATIANVNSSPTTITIPAANLEITAVYTDATYNITIQQPTNGTITPADSFVANYNDSQLFTATPDDHYHVKSWLFNGSVVQSGGDTCNLQNISQDYNIQVTFELDTYTVTVTAGSNGSVSPENSIISYGGEITLTATPEESYLVSEWRVNDNLLDSTSNSITITNVTETMNIAVTFIHNGDFDNDNMNDIWEQQYNANGLEPDGDEDGDNIPNLVEFLTDHNPTVKDNGTYVILYPGWNLIAFTDGTPIDKTILELLEQKNQNNIFCWDKEKRRYNVANQEIVCCTNGYWVQAAQLCAIYYSN